jgi:hypothetical protein
MLDELVAHAPDGKLVLHVLDPVPFSEEEDRAEQFGVTNIGTMDRSVFRSHADFLSVGKSDVIRCSCRTPGAPAEQQFLGTTWRSSSTTSRIRTRPSSVSCPAHP